MNDRPYVLLSATMSVDGCLDDASDRRLVLSGAADLDRVDELRASVDAIMVGANTVRRDDPRLLVRNRPGRPAKVTVTRSGDLDPAARFFTEGTVDKYVYAANPVVPNLAHLNATVLPAGDPASLSWVLADLAARGIGRLMVEGGGEVHTQLLTAGLVDELQLAIAPFFVGDADAPRFTRPGTFPQDAGNRMRLAGVHTLEDIVVLRYLVDP